MKTTILDGKKVAEGILAELKEKIFSLDRKPKLAIVLCGENPESIIYTNIKKKKGESIGVNVDICKLKENILQDEIENYVEKLNETYDGIIVQLPLPGRLETRKILDKIHPDKDVDGLTAYSLGKTMLMDEKFAPATPKGIINLLEHYNIDLKGKNVVIINNSNILGKPLSVMMRNRKATVTTCHTSTKNIKEIISNAEILVSGVGTPNFIKKNMVKEGSVIIDAGMKKENNKIKGDVDFENVKEKTSFITPNPGGTGPMTVAALMENVYNTIK